jgi:osmotically-inducible protein OsmY
MRRDIRFGLMISLIIGTCVLLPGCGGILVAGATVGALAAHDLRPTRVIMQDEVIEHTATDKIYGDPELTKTVHINVYSYNHTVLMTGEALKPELRQKAVDIVRNLEHVKKVYNEVIIEDLANFQSRSDDTWLTTKVKNNMYGTKDFAASRVKVITNNDTVYLMGLVTKEQGAQAAEIARKVEGVKRVVKLFEYVAPEDTPAEQTQAAT